MSGWFRKSAAPRHGPDFRAVDAAGAQELTRNGHLQKMYLLPLEFGGQDTPANWVMVPGWVVEKKKETDNNIIRPLVNAGTVSTYRATPQYQGESVVPSAINIEASNPGSFTVTIAIWGNSLEQNR